MKRASYRHGVRWIALNDEAGAQDALNVETVSMYVTTLLLADIFDVDPARVAKDIVQVRKKHFSSEASR